MGLTKWPVNHPALKPKAFLSTFFLILRHSGEALPGVLLGLNPHTLTTEAVAQVSDP